MYWIELWTSHKLENAEIIIFQPHYSQMSAAMTTLFLEVWEWTAASGDSPNPHHHWRG